MRRGTGVTAGVLAALVLLLLLWGSGDGSPVLQAPTGSTGPPPSVDLFPQPDNQLETQTVEEQDPGEEAEPLNLDWLVILFGLAVLGIIAAIVKWLLERDIPGGDPPEEDPDEQDDIDVLLRATDEPAALSALAEGEPRNVVVRCWVTLEDAAESSGLERDHSETAAEFTRRLLSRWDVDEATTAELAALYREARFSRHPVPRASGERAVELLRSVHSQLRARAARRAAQAAKAEQAAQSEQATKAEQDEGGSQ